jgi:hypothetical protein
MATENIERWKEVVGQLRGKTMFAVAGSFLLGGCLALDTWEKREDFYLLQLIVCGFLTIAFTHVLFRDLARLSWSINAEEAKWKKGKARRLTAYILGTMLVFFCFSASLIAARVFGKLYIVGAAILGIFMISIVVATDREIRRLASCFVNPQNQPRI